MVESSKPTSDKEGLFMISTTIFPSRYVQGSGALDLLGEELARLGDNALLLLDPFVADTFHQQIEQTCQSKINYCCERFTGECSDEEINRLVEQSKNNQPNVVVGMGGGKTIDTAKYLADTLGCPVVVVPTLASTDAPCSALSVIYTPTGEYKRMVIFKENPRLVLVDTQIIAKAPARLLVSGMGDALATWFEAEDCAINRKPNMTGRVGSYTAYNLAGFCYETLLEYGELALQAVKRQVVTPALERVVEANTLLSGLGFESGGLSGAHAIHNGFTALEPTHKYWHGEKVAFGTLCLLMLTDRSPELIDEVYSFCEAVGLPTTLADIGLPKVTQEELLQVATLACASGETIHNIAGGVTPQEVLAAICAADEEGKNRKFYE